MTVKLNGSGLTIEKLVAIARYNEKVELDPAAAERINKCRAMLERRPVAALEEAACGLTIQPMSGSDDPAWPRRSRPVPIRSPSPARFV